MLHQVPQQCPLVFCYLGGPLPPYAVSAIELAAKTVHVPIILLADERAPDVPPAVEVFQVRDFWRRPDGFGSFISHPHEMRNQFWIRTWERFPVLFNFAQATGLQSYIHAELDQLLSDLRPVQRWMLTAPTPLAAPWHSPRRIVGSVFLVACNDALASLIEFSETGASFPSEMDLLSSFSNEWPKVLGGLPTLDWLIYRQFVDSSQKIDSVVDVPWLFDPARLGMFSFGEDPRNTHRLRIRGGFHNLTFENEFFPEVAREAWRQELAGTVITFGSEDFEIRTRSFGNFRLVNVHVHSKVHGRILQKGLLNNSTVNGHSSRDVFGLNLSAPINFLKSRLRGTALGDKFTRLKQALS